MSDIFYVLTNNISKNELRAVKVLTDDSGKPIINPSYGITIPTSGTVPAFTGIWGNDARLIARDSSGTPLADQSLMRNFLIPYELNVADFVKWASVAFNGG